MDELIENGASDSMALTLTHLGQQFTNFTESALQAAGVPQDVIDAAKTEVAKEAAKAEVRARINAQVDQLSREGVISDVAAVMVVGLASVVKALSVSKDLEAAKAALAPIEPISAVILSRLATPEDLKNPQAAIAAGKLVFPYMVKGGAEAVITDMAELANGVSATLLAAKS